MSPVDLLDADRREELLPKGQRVLFRMMQQCTALEDALRRYGQHAPGCNPVKCTCGFTGVLDRLTPAWEKLQVAP
jgi:hypothetical protein